METEIKYKEKLWSDPVWIRTRDLQLRRLSLYPAELRDRKGLKPHKKC